MDKKTNPVVHMDLPDQQERDQWIASGDYKLLQIYTYYRTLLSSLLLLMFTAGIGEKYLGTFSPTLFAITVMIYTATNVVSLVGLWQKQFNPKFQYIIAILLTDVVVLTLLTFASGGRTSSLGYLLLVCIAAGGIFLRARANLALAGFASTLVIAQSLIFYFGDLGADNDLLDSAVLGILLFATALVFTVLSERIRRSNLEASQKTKQAAYLKNLSQLIIERMRTGIVVVNSNYEIVLVNHAAKTLLNYGKASKVTEDDPLYQHLRIWKAYPHTRSPHIKAYESGPEVRISFAPLEPKSDSDTLVFVEDNRLFSQEAQQLKLASLGRLTASIAHEVRNPLAAISHAAQLLQESPDIPKADLRLTEIIQNHSRRVNQIIENVLQLSRRKTSTSEVVCINDWLPDFTDEYNHSGNSIIEISYDDSEIKTRVDVSQLEQILTNLCDNGLRYSEENTGRRHLLIRAGIDLKSETPYIEIIDDGVGIPDENVQQVFEPFFTTASTGSGLGLYICRELCEANQANLEYKKTEAGKSCFRINFTHHERIF